MQTQTVKPTATLSLILAAGVYGMNALASVFVIQDSVSPQINSAMMAVLLICE